MERYKYYFRLDFIDNNCQDTPPSMPEWISRETCAKCNDSHHRILNKQGNFHNIFDDQRVD